MFNQTSKHNTIKCGGDGAENTIWTEGFKVNVDQWAISQNVVFSLSAGMCIPCV